MSIVITVNYESKRGIHGTIWTYDGVEGQFKNYLENGQFSSIENKPAIKQKLESGNELYILMSDRYYAAIGNYTIEGCSYKPEGYYFEIIEESTKDSLEEALFDLEEKLKEIKEPKIKRKVSRSNTTPIIKTA